MEYLGRGSSDGLCCEEVNDRTHKTIDFDYIWNNPLFKNVKGEEDVYDIYPLNPLFKLVEGEDEDDDNYPLMRRKVMGVEERDDSQSDDSVILKKGKWKMQADAGHLDVDTAEIPITEAVAADVELEIKPQKKPFTLITPTVHSGFSFSIIHLLTAVRMALITPPTEDTLEAKGELKEKHDGEVNGVVPNQSADDGAGGGKLPSLTVQEIVDWVSSNPGDPCILEAPERLNDLVRGVLKIFYSKTAPPGALIAFEKPKKSWSWIGPLSNNPTDVLSPEAWGLTHKMLVKLVDSFANWLKSCQETLQQLGSLTASPACLLQFNQNKNKKDRFTDLHGKCPNTITSSTEEVKEFFRREEFLRYSIPDRAFAYTAADGEKSSVAPLTFGVKKRDGKAPNCRMLRSDRPPYVTINSLVRDAAARLPESIGTRRDVCTLLRDSQYIKKNVSDAKIYQAVSGGLDRLQYQLDSCVIFDPKAKLWTYLHRHKEEDEFDEDGTTSTKNCKSRKKNQKKKKNCKSQKKYTAEQS